MAYLIVLIAALLHAVWNSMMKESADRLVTLGAIRLVGILFGLTVIFFTPAPGLDALLYIAATAAVLFLYYYFLIGAYSHGDFSQSYPISRGCAPLLLLFASQALGTDSMTTAEQLAIVLVSLGVLTLTLSKPIQSGRMIVYSLATAATICCYTLLSGIGVRNTGSFLTFAAYLELLCGIGVLGFIGVHHRTNPVLLIMNGKRRNLIAGILSVCGFGSAMWAMQSIPIATVGALRETSIIFAALIGIFWLNEERSATRLIAAVLVTTGVMLLGMKG